MLEAMCSCGRMLCTASIKLFQDLPRSVQAEIVKNAGHEEVPAGIHIVTEGDVADSLYIIREGKVKRSRFDAEGKEYILDIHVAGEVVGEDTFLIKDHYDYYIQTLSPTKFCSISRQILRDLLSTHSDWSLEMISHLSRRLHEANARVQLLMENNALKRVAGFLLARDERLEGDPIALTIDDIAGSTNLRRETVSRKITELQNLGLVHRQGQKKNTLINRHGLLETFFEG